jgi:NADH:ubiquinone reductase (H+-translocating)
MSTTVELPTSSVPSSTPSVRDERAAQPISRFNLSKDDNRYALPHVVIIGGGFGGLTAARSLNGAPVRVTLLDRRNHHVFQPLLYQVATAGLSPGDIASPIRWILRRQRNVRVLLGEVKAIDVETRHVILDEGFIPYDYLIVATGATHAYFGHDEWRTLAPGLKDLDDALTIRRRVLLAFEQAERVQSPRELRRLLTFVVIGGGPTGVELAGALAEIARQTLRNEYRTFDPSAARVILLEGGPEILTAFPEELRENAMNDLYRLGVEVRTKALVTKIAPTMVEVGKEKIEVGTVLWAAGVGASPLGASLGTPRDRAGRVIVEPDLSIPGHREVFVIGDLAAYTHQDGKLLPGVAPVAMQEAKYVAGAIESDLRKEPRDGFHYRNLGNLATIGRAAAVADFGWIRFSGSIAWVLWLFVHIMMLIGFRNRIVVFTQWAWAYFTRQRSVRLITGEGVADDSCPPPA